MYRQQQLRFSMSSDSGSRIYPYDPSLCLWNVVLRLCEFSFAYLVLSGSERLCARFGFLSQKILFFVIISAMLFCVIFSTVSMEALHFNHRIVSESFAEVYFAKKPWFFDGIKQFIRN